MCVFKEKPTSVFEAQVKIESRANEGKAARISSVCADRKPNDRTGSEEKPQGDNLHLAAASLEASHRQEAWRGSFLSGACPLALAAGSKPQVATTYSGTVEEKAYWIQCPQRVSV